MENNTVRVRALTAKLTLLATWHFCALRLLDDLLVCCSVVACLHPPTDLNGRHVSRFIFLRAHLRNFIDALINQMLALSSASLAYTGPVVMPAAQRAPVVNMGYSWSAPGEGAVYDPLGIVSGACSASTAS